MKKSLLALTSGLLLIAAVGCSSAEKQDAEVIESAAITEEFQDTVEPVNDTIYNENTSLGSSSSGLGH